MYLIEAYKFCPKCGGALEKKSHNLLQCLQCSYEFWVNPSPSASVIIENDQNEVLLVKRAVPPHQGAWDIPGGFMEPGESFIQAAKREIREELEVEIEITHLLGAYPDLYSYKGANNPCLSLISAAKITSGELKVADDFSGYRYFAKSKVLELQIAFTGVRAALREYISHEKTAF